MAEAEATVMVVDDDAALSKVLASLIAQAGHQVVTAASGEEALSVMNRRPVDAVISDLRMPGMDGMSLLGRIGAEWPEVPVVILSAHGTVPLAVEAMRAGAADFLLKPFEREEVLFVLKKALARLESEPPRVPASRDARDALELVGNSPAMAEVRETVERAAPGNATVLIRGETGTGKELVARAVHQASPRRSRPFVKLNCAALPDSLLESELFGHEKGAFTGAVARKPGRVELAHGGTLFLDEIGDVPLATQVKLLRILQERELERLGGTETVKVDVRFVAATHRDLETMMAAGQFREDLFYRLNVVPLRVPPLRERRDDIVELARHFAKSAAASAKKPLSLDAQALELLAAQPWPGNVRQLENFVERLLVLSDGPVIRPSDVERELARENGKPGQAASSTAPPLDAQRKDAERRAILDALSRAGNNRSLAARLLGVSRRTLYNKLEELGVG